MIFTCLFILCVYIYVHMCVFKCTYTLVQSNNNFQGSLFPFCHVGPGIEPKLSVLLQSHFPAEPSCQPLLPSLIEYDLYDTASGTPVNYPQVQASEWQVLATKASKDLKGQPNLPDHF